MRRALQLWSGLNGTPPPYWRTPLALLRWVRQQRCSARELGGCNGPIQAHHQIERRGGKIRTHDITAIPLCMRHHIEQWHGYDGVFRDWSKDQRYDWEQEQIRETRRRWAGVNDLAIAW